MEDRVKKPTISRPFKRKILKKGKVTTNKFDYESTLCDDGIYRVFRTNLITGERSMVKVG